MVVGGTFQYRCATRRAELMSPGSLFLGNPGALYECSHDHSTGDRCIAFHFTPELFAQFADAAPRFRTTRVPPSRVTAPWIARACAAMAGTGNPSWEELAIELAARSIQLVNDIDHHLDDTRPDAPDAVARVTRAVRIIEHHFADDLPLQRLAADARLSPYHFLRTFTRITGVTPHQFALRARLRRAAMRLANDDARVLDIALDCGFGDLSNFNRTFRAEFGAVPRAWRRRVRNIPVDADLPHRRSRVGRALLRSVENE